MTEHEYLSTVDGRLARCCGCGVWTFGRSVCTTCDPTRKDRL